MTAYSNIKDIVIGTTHNLDMVPVEVLTDLCGGDAHSITGEYLTGIENTSITCITHAYMPTSYNRHYDDGWGEWENEVEVLLYVCTILVDNVPALFFVHAKSDDWWEPYTYTYMLDTNACTIFVLLVAERIAWVCGSTITEDEDVKELSEVAGVEIEYGRPPYLCWCPTHSL